MYDFLVEITSITELHIGVGVGVGCDGGIGNGDGGDNGCETAIDTNFKFYINR